MDAWNVFKHLLSIAKELAPTAINDHFKYTFQGYAKMTESEIIKFCFSVAGVYALWVLLVESWGWDNYYPSIGTLSFACMGASLYWGKIYKSTMRMLLLGSVVCVGCIIFVPQFKLNMALLFVSCHLGYNYVLIKFICSIVFLIILLVSVMSFLRMCALTSCVVLQKGCERILVNWEGFCKSMRLCRKAYLFIKAFL